MVFIVALGCRNGGLSPSAKLVLKSNYFVRRAKSSTLYDVVRIFAPADRNGICPAEVEFFPHAHVFQCAVTRLEGIQRDSSGSPWRFSPTKEGPNCRLIAGSAQV